MSEWCGLKLSTGAIANTLKTVVAYANNKTVNTPSIDFTVNDFVCVKLTPVGHMSKSGITLNVLHIRVVWNENLWRTYRSCLTHF